MIGLIRAIAAIGRPHSRVLGAWYPGSDVALSIEWKAADLWIGMYVYTQPVEGTNREQTDVYIVPIPTIVLHIAYRLVRQGKKT